MLMTTQRCWDQNIFLRKSINLNLNIFIALFCRHLSGSARHKKMCNKPITENPLLNLSEWSQHSFIFLLCKFLLLSSSSSCRSRRKKLRHRDKLRWFDTFFVLFFKINSINSKNISLLFFGRSYLTFIGIIVFDAKNRKKINIFSPGYA